MGAVGVGRRLSARGHIHMVRQRKRAGDGVADDRLVGIRNRAVNQRSRHCRQHRRYCHRPALQRSGAPFHGHVLVCVDAEARYRHREFGGIVGGDDRARCGDNIVHLSRAENIIGTATGIGIAAAARCRQVRQGAGNETDLAVNGHAIRNLDASEIEPDHHRRNESKFNRRNAAPIAAEAPDFPRHRRSRRHDALPHQ